MPKEKFEIAVSGAAEITPCSKNIEKLASEIGRELAKRNCNLITGATTGVPYLVAKAFKEAGGFSIGFSPAASEKEHIKTYRLPTDVFDVLIYTSADYAGRNIMMTKSADGVIIICGRMGTLHEFATAFEIGKPIAVLEGSGGIAEKIREIVKGRFRRAPKIIYEKDPKKLVKKLIETIQKEKRKNKGREKIE